MLLQRLGVFGIVLILIISLSLKIGFVYMWEVVYPAYISKDKRVGIFSSIKHIHIKKDN
jgi:hypothetical protein